MRHVLLVASVAALAGAVVSPAAQAAPSIAYVYIIGASTTGNPTANPSSGNFDSWRSAGPSVNLTGFSLVPTGVQTVPSPSSPVPLPLGLDIYAMTSAQFVPATPDPSYAIDIYFSVNGVVDTTHPLQAYIGTSGTRVAEPITNTITSPLYGPQAGTGSLVYNDAVDNETIQLSSFSWATQTVSGQQQQVGGVSFNVTAVPEPAAYLLLATGVIGFGVLRRRPRTTALG